MDELAGRIDFTLLRADATPAEVERLCAAARARRYAAVCVNGGHARRCAEALRGSDVAVCAVAGFPLGAMASGAKLHEARLALDDGAREIDMVIQVGLLKAGLDGEVEREVAALARACHERGGLLKAIVETALLTEEELVRGCRAVERAGGDFVKTSTGFASRGASVQDVARMRAAVGPGVRIKASGGVRTAEAALALVRAGADRIGTSSAL